LRELGSTSGTDVWDIEELGIKGISTAITTA
jgi:hypothetical protein